LIDLFIQSHPITTSFGYISYNIIITRIG